MAPSGKQSQCEDERETPRTSQQAHAIKKNIHSDSEGDAEVMGEWDGEADGDGDADSEAEGDGLSDGDSEAEARSMGHHSLGW